VLTITLLKTCSLGDETESISKQFLAFHKTAVPPPSGSNSLPGHSVTSLKACSYKIHAIAFKRVKTASLKFLKQSAFKINPSNSSK
jgi:hypothetical protein